MIMKQQVGYQSNSLWKQQHLIKTRMMMCMMRVRVTSAEFI